MPTGNGGEVGGCETLGELVGAGPWRVEVMALGVSGVVCMGGWGCFFFLCIDVGELKWMSQEVSKWLVSGL